MGDRPDENVQTGVVKKMRDYFESGNSDGYGSSIVRPPVQATDFEIKPEFITFIQNTLQFSGSSQEDPNQHLTEFLEACDLVKFNEVSNDAIRLRLFKYSLRDKAKAWLRSREAGSITTWEELKKVFLQKYFPPMKFAKLRNEINGFRQMNQEPLYEAWERYKELLRRCPNHQLPKWMIIQTFYNGLETDVQMMIDIASGGSMNNKTPAEVYELIEAMASNHHEREFDRARKGDEQIDIDEVTSLKARVAALQRQIDKMSVNAVQIPIQICELCSGNHATQECQVGNSFAQSEQTNYLNNLQRGQINFYSNPHQNADNQDRRNQLQNLSWSSNYNDTKHPSQHHEYPEKKLNIEDMFSKIMDKIDKTTEQVEKRFEVNELKIQNHDVTLKILELQVGQIHEMLSQRPQGGIPSDTEKNSREQANAITLRSGTKYEGPKQKEPEVE